MSTQPPASALQLRMMGAGAGAIGLYFMLVGVGLLPLPGGPRNLHGPLWIVLLVGLAFFLAGVAIVIQIIGKANASGDLPPTAPLWIRLLQYAIGVTIFASFAVMGSWIAFGAGPRQFSGTVMFFDGATNAMIGRAVFGFGAVICWFGTIAFAVVGARKLRNGSET